MTYTPWDPITGAGTATCKTDCDKGYTSNGSDPKSCVKCSEECETCQDDNRVGDNKRCIKCNAQIAPFMYSPEQMCMKECGLGFYKVESANPPACDKCSQPCSDCSGDKYNCTQCDALSPQKTLYVQSLSIDGQMQARGSCYNSCPAGFFMNEK